MTKEQLLEAGFFQNSDRFVYKIGRGKNSIVMVVLIGKRPMTFLGMDADDPLDDMIPISVVKDIDEVLKLKTFLEGK